MQWKMPDLGEGVLAGSGYSRYFSLRGLPVAAFDSNRVVLFSGEYRIPLVSPQRGLGTWPVFLNNLHPLRTALRSICLKIRQGRKE